ncbi:MAG TPA: MFS transporter [Verrucomicrobiae bacterium]|nr:MFS transporter [Verrucomicrobiae bacterium]
MRDVLKHTGFRRLWIAVVVLTLGDAVMQMGLIEYFRANQYDVATETAKMLFAVSLPGLLLGPLAIAYLDRWQRRSVLMLSDALRAVTVVVIAAWLWPVVTGRMESRGLLVVYLVIFLNGAVTTFHYPARFALLPNLLDAGQLIQANTLLTATIAVAGVGGRGVGGFLAERMGPEWAVLANALAYVVSVVLVWTIRMQPHATTSGEHAHPQGGWGELRTGLSYLWTHRTALPLVVLTAVFAFVLSVLAVAFVGFAMTDPPSGLGLRTGGFGYLFVAVGAGGGLGMFVIGRAKRWTRSTWLPVVQLAMCGALLVVLSRMTSPWLAAAVLVVLGVVAAPLMIPIDSKLQEQVDEKRRGAVFAARGALTSATMIVAFWLQFGTAFFRETPAPTILLWLGVGSIAIAVVAALALRARQGRPGMGPAA